MTSFVNGNDLLDQYQFNPIRGFVNTTFFRIFCVYQINIQHGLRLNVCALSTPLLAAEIVWIEWRPNKSLDKQIARHIFQDALA